MKLTLACKEVSHINKGSKSQLGEDVQTLEKVASAEQELLSLVNNQ
jgi:hypothetical protein